MTRNILHCDINNLSIRLTQLGLVDRNYFGNPYDLTDIYCDGGI